MRLGLKLAVGPGFEPGSHRLTAGCVAFATSLQAATDERWLADVDSNHDSRLQRSPSVGRSANGRVGRTRTSTDLRPRQVGYRLPDDPRTFGVSDGSRTR